jgi:hypothetical protein
MRETENEAGEVLRAHTHTLMVFEGVYFILTTMRSHRKILITICLVKDSSSHEDPYVKMSVL